MIGEDDFCHCPWFGNIFVILIWLIIKHPLNLPLKAAVVTSVHIMVWFLLVHCYILVVLWRITNSGSCHNLLLWVMSYWWEFSFYWFGGGKKTLIIPFANLYPLRDIFLMITFWSSFFLYNNMSMDISCIVSVGFYPKKNAMVIDVQISYHAILLLFFFDLRYNWHVLTVVCEVIYVILVNFLFDCK